MARPSVFSVEDRFRLVLSVISGEMTTAESARRGKTSEQSISTWKRQVLEGGKAQAGAYEELEVIRLEAGMTTSRFVRLIGVPERSYRR